MKKTVKSMVDDAMSVITTYSVEEAQELHGRDDVQFVDIRDVRELEREGIVQRLCRHNHAGGNLLLNQFHNQAGGAGGQGGKPARERAPIR